MWWEPRDDSEASLGNQVAELLGRYQEYLEESREPVIYGVGSALSEAGDWRPLLLASWEVLTRDNSEDRPVPFGRWTTGALVDMLGSAGEVPSLLRAWDVRSDWLVDVTTRPVAGALVRAGDSVANPYDQPRYRVGRLGLPCTSIASGRPAFITAGHLVDGPQSQLYIEGATAKGRTAWVSGTVTEWSDPNGMGPTGGFDYALLELDDPGTNVAQPLAVGSAYPIPSLPHLPMNVIVVNRPGQGPQGVVSGVLDQLGDGARQWRACWSWASDLEVTQGDSGSVAIGLGPGPSQGQVFGHFVGGSYSPGSGPPKFLHRYVQDLGQTLANSTLGNAIRI